MSSSIFESKVDSIAYYRSLSNGRTSRTDASLPQIPVAAAAEEERAHAQNHDESIVLGTFTLNMDDDYNELQIFRFYSNTNASELLADACHQRRLSSNYFSLVMVTSSTREFPSYVRALLCVKGAFVVLYQRRANHSEHSDVKTVGGFKMIPLQGGLR